MTFWLIAVISSINKLMAKKPLKSTLLVQFEQFIDELLCQIYIIGGDIAQRPANLTGMGDWKGYLAPILGRSGSALNLFKTYEWILQQIDGDMSRLVLTHDSTMGERFESKPTADGLAIHYVC